MQRKSGYDVPTILFCDVMWWKEIMYIIQYQDSMAHAYKSENVELFRVCLKFRDVIYVQILSHNTLIRVVDDIAIVRKLFGSLETVLASVVKGLVEVRFRNNGMKQSQRLVVTIIDAPLQLRRRVLVIYYH